MNVTMTPALTQQPEFARLAATAEQAVRAEIKSATANAQWDYSVDDRGRPLLLLKLADGLSGRAMGRFAPDELRQETELRNRLHEMQGSLLLVSEWCQHTLPALYQDLRRWAEAMDPPCLVEDALFEVNERLSGPYAAPGLSISRGAEVVEAQPIAIWVVTAEGRVDLVSSLDRYLLVLRNGVWYATAPTEMQEHPLSEQVFRAAFEAVLA